MIGDNYGLAARRLVMLEAFYFDAVEKAEQLPGKICRRFLGKDEAAPNGRYRIGKAETQEQSPRRDELQQDDRNYRGRNHEDRIDDIVGGNHARALGRRGAGLHDGIQRHGIDAAEEGGEKQVKDNAPACPVGKENA